jgi:hypothetical protein
MTPEPPSQTRRKVPRRGGRNSCGFKVEQDTDKYLGSPSIGDARLRSGRPGPGGAPGNVTGLSYFNERSGKRLQLIKEVVPGLVRVAVLRDPLIEMHTIFWRDTEVASQRLGVGASTRARRLRGDGKGRPPRSTAGELASARGYSRRIFSIALPLASSSMSLSR